MPKSKPYLKIICRSDPKGLSRKGYLRLDMNEGIPGLPEDFVKKVIAEIKPELLATYPEYNIIQEKIARHANLKQKNICLANGSAAAIKYIFDAYISKRDKVLLTDPTFAMYPVYCTMFGAKPVTVQYNSDLSFPTEDFIKSISRNIKLAIIVNPNNPTGSVMEQGDLIAIIKKAADNDVVLVVDEAYFFFYPNTAIDMVKKYKNLIVLRTFSKLCGLAAVRFGYAAACPEIVENLNKVRPPYDVNSIAALFAVKLIDSPSIIQNLLKQTNEGKDYLIKKLSDEGTEYYTGYANFILIKCPYRTKDIARDLMRKNILIGYGFRQPYLKDYIRVTVGSKKYMEYFWRFFIKIIRRKL